MSSGLRSPGVIKQLWIKWKALRLPWRKQFLVGADLAGNTFWEFKDALNSNRFRRIVRYNSHQAHYSDIKITPQWHQWLRHTRFDAPTLKEQEIDVARQIQMKQLAARADERWRSQESFLDAPARQQTAPAIALNDPGGYAQQTEPTQNEGVSNAVEAPQDVKEAVEGRNVDGGRFRGHTREKSQQNSPYNKANLGGPSENWQPQSWTPGAAAKR